MPNIPKCLFSQYHDFSFIAFAVPLMTFDTVINSAAVSGAAQSKQRLSIGSIHAEIAAGESLVAAGERM